MANPTRSLIVKNGNGELEELAVGVDDEGLVPFHAIYGNVTVTASAGAPVAVQIPDGLTVSNFPETQTVTATSANPIFEIKTKGIGVEHQVKTVSDYDWTVANGAFRIATLNEERKEIMICNASQASLYIKLSPVEEDDASFHGFTIDSTSSAPSNYNFIIYPSGTYMSSDASRVFYHAGYFISGSEVGNVTATSIT